MVRMDLFRSEEMNKVQLIIPVESAHDTMTYLAECGLLQFKDLNSGKSPFQRAYANQATRCGEMARKLRWFQDEITKAGQKPVPRPVLDKDIELEDLEVKLEELEAELLEINSNSEKLQRSYSELMELGLVLHKASSFFSLGRSAGEVHQRRAEIAMTMVEIEDMDRPLLLEQEMQTDPSKQTRLGFITGVVAKSKFVPFERIIFRATRGNMYLKQSAVADPVVDPATGEKIEKVVFVVFFAGDRARLKITKICEAFGANRYPFPEDASRQRQMKAEVNARLSELQATLNAGKNHRDNVFTSIGYNLDHWIIKVRREKAVYHTLNMLSVDVTRKCLVAEGWCPVKAKPQGNGGHHVVAACYCHANPKWIVQYLMNHSDKIQDALQRAAYDSNSQLSTVFQVMHTKESPPTFYELNKFTAAFQEIVDAYGVARYQEVNPGCFTIVTFPFLFAVMFGDWGHGFAILFAALYLIWKEKKYENQELGDIMAMMFSGRYVILLMSIFSIYTGFIYNEFFSVPFLWWDSAYQCRDPKDCSDAYSSGLVKWSPLPYPFGIDPAWHGSRTELPFLNSLKMKMSILMGVSQMNLGILLSWWNATFYHNKLDIWFNLDHYSMYLATFSFSLEFWHWLKYQFLPQLLFLNALFGYLSMLILIKWCQGSKPDLYHVMIYMFLSPNDDLGENQLFWGQSGFQRLLVMLAFVAVPWMLFPKPFKLKKQHLQKMQGRSYGVLGGSDTDSMDLEHENQHDEEDFDFSEVFVHQMIHTIEFVLGAVSNTASYLRLWALSLAHAQLSAVFFEKILVLSFSYTNPVIRAIGMLLFGTVTVGVLLIMESLSAFLHALRLHWVEFQNKFYAGDGHKFKPFAFKDLVVDVD